LLAVSTPEQQPSETEVKSDGDQNTSLQMAPLPALGGARPSSLFSLRRLHFPANGCQGWRPADGNPEVAIGGWLALRALVRHGDRIEPALVARTYVDAR
jgi:hypothetical protein